MAQLSTREKLTLESLSKKLRVKPDHLCDLINMESNWNPRIKNRTSSARGLIQFMDKTAKGMGYPGGSQQIIDTYPDRISQLNTPVYNYLKPYSPFPSRQSLYMAVFRPEARKWPLNKLFPKFVRDANPNIDTVGDYMAFAKRKAEREPTNCVTTKKQAGSPIKFIAITIIGFALATFLFDFTTKK